MRILNACLVALVLSTGCSRQPAVVAAVPEPQSTPVVALRIECESSTFKVDEDITVMIWITNLTDKELDAPTTYWSARVIVDGKEYKRPDESIGPWNGPAVIIPQGELHTGLSLSGFINTKEILTAGKHTVAIKIGDAVSNTLTITIAEDR